MTYANSPASADTVLTGAERFWYIVLCILTFGAPYFHKIVVKKSMVEALIAFQAFNGQSFPTHPASPK